MSRAVADALPWHAANWALLQVARRNDRLAHAWLLEGPAGLGKQGFARRLAAALVCTAPGPDGEACGRCRACQQCAADTHPDVLTLTPEEPGKPIRIDAVRELSARSVLTAEASGYRVCLICPADAMTPGAANALLKTLEEPVPRTVLLLISAQPNRLPATIRSRCQQLRFTPPAAAEARRWLASQAGGAAAEPLLGLAGGAPLRALALAAEGRGQRLLALADDLAQLLDGRADPVALAAQWQDLPLEATLEYLQQWASDLIRLKIRQTPPMLFHVDEGGRLQSLAHRIDLRRTFLLLDRLTSLRRQLKNNLNPLLVTERVLFECGGLTG
jgi:DNA polymerase-3 subunit delta'